MPKERDDERLVTCYDISLRQLQAEQKSWVCRNFPNRESYYPLLGLQEEVGELAHAHLKALQGIRGTQEEHHAAKIDAVADILIFLSDYCTANDIDLQEALNKEWPIVMTRDWRNDPINGGAAP